MGWNERDLMSFLEDGSAAGHGSFRHDDPDNDFLWRIMICDLRRPLDEFRITHWFAMTCAALSSAARTSR